MTDVDRQFEEWWARREGDVFPPEMRSLFAITFKDGWYRSEKRWRLEED